MSKDCSVVFSFVDMSHNGTLASKHSINLLTYYSIAQCMFIFVCVSCRYRLIVYHVSTTHVDISRMISVKQLWDVFVVSSSSASTLKDGSKPLLSNQTGYSPRVNELDEQLRKYMDAKTPAIHIYTVSDLLFQMQYLTCMLLTRFLSQGLFDADVVLSEKIQLFIKNTILDAYPVSLRIDSVDFVTIIYSLGVLCYMILYHATVNRVKTENRNTSLEDVITIKQINSEYMLNDLFFWLLVFIVIFIVLEISCPVSIQTVSLFFSISFTMLLYTTCSLAHTELIILRSIALLFWAIQAIAVIVLTNATVLDGSCILFINIIFGIFYYISVIEDNMTIIKFLNMRAWCSVLVNFCFVLIYINNIICIDISA